MKDASTPGVAGPASAAPAVGGLGSYKGVMLCSRPPEAGAGGQVCGAGGGAGGGGLVGGVQQPPFRSTIAAAVGEQLGLPPPKRSEPKMEVKTRGPSAALRRHCQWIRELQEQVKDDQRQVEESLQAQDERKERMQQAFKQQRDAIRRIKNETERGSIEPADVEAILRRAGKKTSASVGSRKPLWAMTEDEKDGFEDEEAAQLIRFVEDLDFDRYIDDLEFREQLQIVRDRAKKMQREQDAFKDSLVREFNTNADDDAVTEGEGAVPISAMRVGDKPSWHRTGPADVSRPDWDASTACSSDDRSAAVHSRDTHVHGAAERLLEANPQLRAIHSKGSVQRLIEKAQEAQ